MIDEISMKDICFGAKLVTSFKKTGFAIITDHNIKEETLNSFYKSWSDFFDDEELKSIYCNRPFHAGFFPMKSEKAKGSDSPDLKEFFHYYPSKIDDPTNGKAKHLYTELNNIAKIALFALSNNLPEKVTKKFSMPLQDTVVLSDQTLLRIINYPPIKDVEPGSVRAAAHEDINLITVLPAATEMGLEVKNNHGDWVSVEAKPHSMVLNVGDMLQEMTNGYLKSTSHRVVNVGMEKARMSSPLFLHPRPEVVLSKKYTADQYLNERLKELGLK